MLATRRRIVEAALALHQERGPARTTVSAVADTAGVERLTVYRHFPDARSLLGACSAQWMAANPPPDIASWAAIRSHERRLRRALEQLYAYYRRVEPMMARLQRDRAELPELAELMRGYDVFLEAARDVLCRRDGASLPRLARMAITHALRFETWQSLSETGLKDREAARLMARLAR